MSGHSIFLASSPAVQSDYILNFSTYQMFKQAILPENYTIRSNQIQHVRYGARSVDVSISSSSVLFFFFWNSSTAHTIQIRTFNKKDTVPISFCGTVYNSFVNRRKYSVQQHGCYFDSIQVPYVTRTIWPTSARAHLNDNGSVRLSYFSVMEQYFSLIIF